MPNYDDMPLSEIFKLDSKERIKALNDLVLKLEKEPENDVLYDDAMREAHSLKAAARIVNNKETQDLAHLMESVIQVIKEKKCLSVDYIDLLLRGLDAVQEMVDAFVASRPHGVDVSELSKDLESAKEGRITSKSKRNDEEILSPAPPKAPEAPIVDVRKPGSGDATKKRAAIEKAMIERETGDFSVRVGIEKLNKLMNISGEMYTHMLNLDREQGYSQMLVSQMLKITSSLESLKDHLKESGLASGKADDWFYKNQADLAEFRESLTAYLERIKHVSVSLGYLGTELQDEVMKSRMLPVSTIFDPHGRFVRDAARDSGKSIRFEVKGGDTPVDRSILEVLKDPLAHMVRNACDHGLETSEVRKSNGKPEEGVLSLSAFHEADRVILIIEDDGTGVDEAEIKAKVLDKKLISEDKLKLLSKEEILNLIYLPGFSTAKNVTTLSGRGIGLDVVKSNLARIGGDIHMGTEKGRYTRFVLSLPLTLAVTKSLMVDVGGGMFSIPLTRVAEVTKAGKQDIRMVEGRETVNIKGEILPLVHLASLWGFKSATAESGERPLVVLGTGREKSALWVEKHLGVKEIVSKPLDARLGNLRDISAGAILDDGEVALIVDAESLLSSSAEYTGQTVITSDDKAQMISRKRILVAEDSLTVRELERKVLQNHGYDVEIAVDGLDAFNKIKEATFDLLVTDIEMPRMNGFELISLIKKDKNLRQIPAVIVSFKEREEDKRRGMEVGADKYITKSKYDDQILLDTIARLIG